MRELSSADLFVYYALHSGLNILILEGNGVGECEFINDILNKKKLRKSIIKVSDSECLLDAMTEDEFLHSKISKKNFIVSNRVGYKTLKKVIDANKSGNQFVTVIQGDSPVYSFLDTISNLNHLEAVYGDINYSTKTSNRIDMVVKISEDWHLGYVVDNIMFTQVNHNTHKVELINVVEYDSFCECYELTDDARVGIINKIFTGLTSEMKDEFEELIYNSLVPWASKPYAKETGKVNKCILKGLIPNIKEFDNPIFL